MRNRVVVLTIAAFVTVSCSGLAGAADRPPAALVPPDVSTYQEVNLDRVLGKAPETAALREVFAEMQSPKLVRGMIGRLAEENPEVGETAVDVTEALTGLSEALGPRVGWATWTPDMSAMMGGMMGAGMGGPMPGGMPGLPKVLLVAEVRDAPMLDEIIQQIADRLEIPARVMQTAEGERVVTFAEGMVELVAHDDWMAIGFPPEQAQQAADRAKDPALPSLAIDAAYRRAMARLPADTIMSEYVSAAAVQQMLGLANMLAPEAGLSYSVEEAVAIGVGVRIEERGGARMATLYYTVDLDAVPPLIDAPVAMWTKLLEPALERSQQSARKAVCLSNVKNLSLAMQMFVADNEDRFPEAHRWVEALHDYIKSEDVLKCPEDDSDARCSYAMNEALSGLSLSDLDDPSSVVLFFETAEPGDNPVGGPDDVVSPGRHMGGNNYGFADGHASWSAEVPDFGVE